MQQNQEVLQVYNDLSSYDQTIWNRCMSDKKLVSDLIEFYNRMDMYVEDFETTEDVLDNLNETRSAEDSYGSFGCGMLDFIFRHHTQTDTTNQTQLTRHILKVIKGGCDIPHAHVPNS